MTFMLVIHTDIYPEQWRQVVQFVAATLVVA